MKRLEQAAAFSGQEAARKASRCNDRTHEFMPQEVFTARANDVLEIAHRGCAGGAGDRPGCYQSRTGY
jgi:hypothetical protein